MSGITILGATGTIGINTLEVLKYHQQKFDLIALTAHSNVELLRQQCQQWRPRYAVMADTEAAERLRPQLRHLETEVLGGLEGLIQVSRLPEVDIVMAAIVGSAGLLPTLAAAHAGKRILLANKEALVMSGQLFMDAIQAAQAELLPIDSEHNAIFQCMPAQFHQSSTLADIGVSRILLTASGGPFRQLALDQLDQVTPEQACHHPNWTMGPKISVDSATMMNKGLEVIEASWLFSISATQIEVVLHPQSIIHSLVEYIDGSMLAQLSHPDMRTPIAHALAWPQRITSGVPQLQVEDMARLEFSPLNIKRFPCVQLAFDALSAGGTTTTILNAANEIAVHAFLQKQLKFTAIPTVIETTLSQLSGQAATTLDVILEADAQARQIAQQTVAQLS